MTSSLEFRSARLAGVITAACLSVGVAGAQAATTTSQVLSPYDNGTTSTQVTSPPKQKKAPAKNTSPPKKQTSGSSGGSAKPASSPTPAPAAEPKPTHLAFTGFDTRIPGAAGLLLIGAGGLLLWRRRSGDAGSIS